MSPKRGKAWKPSQGFHLRNRRLAIAFGLPLVAALAALALVTCSSSQRRDQNYGTDAGAGYQPEAASFTSPDTSADEETTDDASAVDAGAADASAEAGQETDAEVGF
jgi:hypothetical protein